MNQINSSGPSNPVRGVTDGCVICRSVTSLECCCNNRYPGVCPLAVIAVCMNAASSSPACFSCRADAVVCRGMCVVLIYSYLLDFILNILTLLLICLLALLLSFQIPIEWQWMNDLRGRPTTEKSSKTDNVVYYHVKHLGYGVLSNISLDYLMCGH